MSISLYLYLKKTLTKTSIENVICPLGFKPNESTENSYYWFEEKNYESLSGVQLYYILKPDPENRHAPKGTNTTLLSVTYGLRSYEDIAMQNKVIRKLRSALGGSVYNDNDGRYAYIENNFPRLSPAEKRCGLIYERLQRNMSQVYVATSDPNPKLVSHKEFTETRLLLALLDRGIIINNLIAVFLVSILETFLKDLFIAYVEMHPNLREEIFNRDAKIEFRKLKELLEKKKSIVEVEADSYNFQNLNSANNAYSKYLQLNLFKLWNRKKKIGKRFYNVRQITEELIQLRHNIVHNAYVELDFDREKVNKYRQSIESASKFLVEALEKQGFRIDLNKYL